MNHQASHGRSLQLESRVNAFARALRFEGLENRRLLAADVCDLDPSAAMLSDDVATADGNLSAEVSTPVVGATGDLNADVSASGTASLLSAVDASEGGTLATMSLELADGQSFELALSRSDAGVFSLAVINASDGELLRGGTTLDAMSSVTGDSSIDDESLTTSSVVDATLGDSSLADASVELTASPDVTDANADLSESGLVDAWSSFFPASLTSSARDHASLNGLINAGIHSNSSSNIAAPLISDSMTSASLDSLLSSSLGPAFSSGVDVGTLLPTGVTNGFDGSLVSGNSILEPQSSSDMLATTNGDSSLDIDAVDSFFGSAGDLSGSVSDSLRASGESSTEGASSTSDQGTGFTGPGMHHSDDDPTTEELIFRSRA